MCNSYTAYAWQAIVLLGFFPFFRTPSSEVTVRNSTKLYYTFGCRPDIKVVVQNLFFSPITCVPNCLFSDGFTATSILKRAYHQNETSYIEKIPFEITKGPLSFAKIWWTLAQKRLIHIVTVCDPPCVHANFAFSKLPACSAYHMFRSKPDLSLRTVVKTLPTTQVTQLANLSVHDRCDARMPYLCVR